MDEGQLKALLDEAITYKNPKDREGKSELFKVSELFWIQMYILVCVSTIMLKRKLKIVMHRL